MSLVGRETTLHHRFGPYILQTTISDELYDILLKVAYKIRKNKKLKKENDYRKHLAGNLSEEYSYDNAFNKREDFIVNEELTWLASHYTKCAKQNIKKNFDREPKDIIMQRPVWVNFMKQGEWNPSHSHSGDISCVAYLKVPKEIEEENNTTEVSSKSNTPSAGKIEFQYGENIGYCNNGYMIVPKEKQIWFFPAKLQHLVYPFKSKTERISVSVNFADRINAMRNLQARGER